MLNAECSMQNAQCQKAQRQFGQSRLFRIQHPALAILIGAFPLGIDLSIEHWALSIGHWLGIGIVNMPAHSATRQV
jgi:hypothetical protein